MKVWFDQHPVWNAKLRIGNNNLTFIYLYILVPKNIFDTYFTTNSFVNKPIFLEVILKLFNVWIIIWERFYDKTIGRSILSLFKYFSISFSIQ